MEVTPELIAAALDQSSGAIGYIEAIEISHSKWDSVLRYQSVSNPSVFLTHEDSNTYEYSYAEISITKSPSSDTLDQSISFSFGDLGEIVPNLIDSFILDDDIELPIVNYRMYLIGSYSQPMIYEKGYELDSITRDGKGANCEAKSPSLNESGNGDRYTVDLFPSLIGYY